MNSLNVYVHRHRIFNGETINKELNRFRLDLLLHRLDFLVHYQVKLKMNFFQKKFAKIYCSYMLNFRLWDELFYTHLLSFSMVLWVYTWVAARLLCPSNSFTAFRSAPLFIKMGCKCMPQYMWAFFIKCSYFVRRYF